MMRSIGTMRGGATADDEASHVGSCCLSEDRAKNTLNQFVYAEPRIVVILPHSRFVVRAELCGRARLKDHFV